LTNEFALEERFIKSSILKNPRSNALMAPLLIQLANADELSLEPRRRYLDIIILVSNYFQE
jgi:hypothetical protein